MASESWLSANWKWLLSVGLLVVGSFVALILALFFQWKKARELMARLRLQEAQSAVKLLEAIRRDRREEFEKAGIEAASIDRQIREAKKRAVAVVHDVQKMTPSEIAAAYRELMKEPIDEIAKRVASKGKRKDR